MKPGQRFWTKDELLLAINLYAKLPFGKMHSRNPQVIELATLIKRTPGSVAFKLVNFASLDPNLQKRGIKGAANSGNLDKEVWNQFYNNWDDAFEESEKLLANAKKINVEELYLHEISKYEKGLDIKRLVNTRVNQYRFRQLVLSNYNNKCCITGLTEPILLIASHITSWSKFEDNRLNPMNGLCLNALHDKAFDAGLLTISAEDYTIKISSILAKKDKIGSEYFQQYHNKPIAIPKKFPPSREFLKIHNEKFKL
ncbi:HNH endonuclease [Flavisolibacter ginsengisoli]|jgi:putative restriction endonuclease|uniref:Putative restriction endonuclease n=1 Tax=Flavisolibacter ginsengisoli DSM 18119 TaxID=1121884 RepID=A0A1M5GEM7_9BACT|nr:HNH endonuclease [Flavisolibacter ginsengisoli]SHG02146.1 putative restriction endonuclease [Flavisolibacter ginsengisoli DSM 18119]